MDGETQTFSHATYTNVQNGNSGTGGAAATNCRIGSGSLQKTAASENPGAFTAAAPQTGWTAWTIAIHPLAAATAIFHEPVVALQAVNRGAVW